MLRHVAAAWCFAAAVAVDGVAAAHSAVGKDLPRIRLKGHSVDHVALCHPSKAEGKQCSYAEPGFTCVDKNGVKITGATMDVGIADITTPGKQRISYQCTDNGTPSSVVYRTVLVSDAYRPTAKLLGSATEYVKVGSTTESKYADPGAECYNYDGLQILPPHMKLVVVMPELTHAGQQSMKYTCIDEDGNPSKPIYRTIVVSEHLAYARPQIKLIGAPTVWVPLCASGIHCNYADRTAECEDKDGKPLPTQSVTSSEPDLTRVGVKTVAYTCTDDEGNKSAPAYRHVVVTKDLEHARPKLKLIGSATEYVQQSHAKPGAASVLSYQDPGAVCEDVRGKKLADPNMSNSIMDTSRLGKQIITYECTDLEGNKAHPVYRTLVVTDNLVPDLPELELVGPGTEYVQLCMPNAANNFGCSYKEPGAACEDRYGRRLALQNLDISVPDITRAGKQTISYACTDDEGNAARPIYRTLVVVKQLERYRPRIRLIGEHTEYLKVCTPQDGVDGCVFSDPGAKCVDKDGAVLADVDMSFPDIEKVGVQTITYTCDVGGIKARPAYRHLVVVKNIARFDPTLRLLGPSTEYVAQCGPAPRNHDSCSYTDPGAACFDRYGKKLASPTLDVSIPDIEVAGKKMIKYSCEDDEGLRARPIYRTLIVTKSGRTEALAIHPARAGSVGAATSTADNQGDAADGVLGANVASWQSMHISAPVPLLGAAVLLLAVLYIVTQGSPPGAQRIQPSGHDLEEASNLVRADSSGSDEDFDANTRQKTSQNSETGVRRRSSGKTPQF
jgi:hypothetical protein